MVILIAIPWFYPAYKAGGPIQSIANMVNSLSGEISFKIYTSNKDLNGTVLKVPENRWVKYNHLTEVYYASAFKFYDPSFRNEIQNCFCNVLFINGLYSMQFTLMPLLFSKCSKKIVSVRGMLHPGALSQKSFKKKIFLSIWKILRLDKKCYFHASNEDEKEYIQKIFGKRSKVFIAQNFPRNFRPQTIPRKVSGSLMMVSVALVSPMKNFLLVLRGLMHCDSDITYNIYGPIKDVIYWDECLQQIKKLPTNISVQYHGDIPTENVEEVLSKNHVFILPSKSENFGHAIYEALTAGKPVITSNNTPWNNLQASKAGINIEPENSNELIDAINLFASADQNELAQWSNGANRYSKNAIDTDQIVDQYHKMFSI